MQNILEDDTGLCASCNCLLSSVQLFSGAVQDPPETGDVGILVIVWVLWEQA